MKYPLFGIIYNWKGLKEENYLYTAEELQRFDKELYEDCMAKPNEWHDSIMPDCSWKTWMGTAIKDKNELEWFLVGNDNDTERVEYDEDWYWENVEDNDLYSCASSTMREALAEIKKE